MNRDESILILTNEEDRKCPRCGRVLPVTSFYRNGDGLQHWCISCQRDYRRTRKMEEILNVLSFQDIPIGQVLGRAAGLSGKQKTDLRKALRYITSKIK